MNLQHAGEAGAAAAFVLGGLAAVKLLATKSDSQIYGRTLVAGNDPNELALTYDDGPNDRSTMNLLDVLARHGVHATFFMVGRYAKQFPQIVRAVHAAGHIVGNHTMTHPNLAKTPQAAVVSELSDCKSLLEDTTGAPVRYFRAPYGARRPRVLRAVRELGMVPVQWNAVGFDWDPIGVDGILRNLHKRGERARRKGRGVNVLLHDGSDRAMGGDRSDTVCATDRLLAQAKEQNRRVVTVAAWG